MAIGQDSYFDPSMLRLQSVANPMPSQPSQTSAPSTPEPEVDDDVSKLVSKLYTPNHEIADKFNQVWSDMPKEEKPTVLRRIVASMVGAGGGPKAADEVLNEPYNTERANWIDKLKMLQPALSEERYNNTNERMLATSAASQTIANKKATEAQRHNLATEELNNQKLEVSKDRAATYKYKAENPDAKMFEEEDGTLMAFDPKSKKATAVLNEDGLPVKSLKNLSAAEKERLEIGSKKDIARIQGEEARKTEETRQTGREALEAKKQSGRIELKQNKDASGKVVSQTINVYDANGNVTGTRTVSTTTEPVKPNKAGDVVVPPNVNKVRMVTPPDAHGKTREIMVPMDKVPEAEARGAKRK